MKGSEAVGARTDRVALRDDQPTPPDPATIAFAPTGFALLAGDVADVLRDARALPRPSEWVLLLHVRESPDRVDAEPSTLPAYIVWRTDVTIPAIPESPALALALPRERVTAALVVGAVPLSPTPLVRSSRALIRSLHRDLRADAGTAASAPVAGVLTALLRSIIDEQLRTTAAPHDGLAARLREIIERRHTDPLLTVDRIAHELHFSRRQLYRLAGGEGVASMLTDRRITTACEMLAGCPHLSVGDVAIRSGFTNSSHLRAHLLRREGVTPSQFRRRALFGEEPASA